MPMTKDQFVALLHHEMGGIIFDALTIKLTGAPLSKWMDLASAKFDKRAGEIYDQLLPPAAIPMPPAAPVQPKQQATAVQPPPQQGGKR